MSLSAQFYCVSRSQKEPVHLRDANWTQSSVAVKEIRTKLKETQLKSVGDDVKVALLDAEHSLDAITDLNLNWLNDDDQVPLCSTLLWKRIPAFNRKGEWVGVIESERKVRQKVAYPEERAEPSQIPEETKLKPESLIDASVETAVSLEGAGSEPKAPARDSALKPKPRIWCSWSGILHPMTAPTRCATCCGVSGCAACLDRFSKCPHCRQPMHAVANRTLDMFLLRVGTKIKEVSMDWQEDPNNHQNKATTNVLYQIYGDDDRFSLD